jgi:hypothetical protein
MLTNAEFHKRFANTYVSFRPAGNGLNHEAVGLPKRNRGIERSALVAATILTSKSVVHLHHNQGRHLARIKDRRLLFGDEYIQSRCASCSRTLFLEAKPNKREPSWRGFSFRDWARPLNLATTSTQPSPFNFNVCVTVR